MELSQRVDIDEMESWLARFNSERLTRAKEKIKERAERERKKEGK
jgi:hypothetical protein